MRLMFLYRFYLRISFGIWRDEDVGSYGKVFGELKVLERRKNIVTLEKYKIINVICDLNRIRMVTIYRAWKGVSFNIGSIFGSLISGATARLVVTNYLYFFDGLFVEVRLGGF
jgi:chromosome segregation ATPase